MTPDANIRSLMHRLDEVERQLERIWKELQALKAPAAIGYSVRRGNLPRKD